jgi:hypothetical protein
VLNTNKRTPYVAVILLVVIVAFAAVAFLSQPKNGETNTPSQSDSFAKGVSLSPRSFNSSDFTDFFQKAKQAGTIVSWAGDWNTLNEANSGATVVTSLSSTYGYTPIIELQFFQQSNGALLRPLDNATMDAYKAEAVAFAEKYQPKYLALGIEVNVLYEKSNSDFDKFVTFYNEVYDAVKAVSPQTNVFPIFQLEKMKGLNGGLFGDTNDPSNSEWSLLDMFPKKDLTVFTTYPGLIYKNPNDIPTDYYTEIQQHTTKPIAFTEIGWHSSSNPVGWESSNTEQAEFITAFFNLTSNLNMKMVIWSFLYDQNTVVPFSSMGLWSTDGRAKDSWNTWITAK